MHLAQTANAYFWMDQEYFMQDSTQSIQSPDTLVAAPPQADSIAEEAIVQPTVVDTTAPEPEPTPASVEAVPSQSDLVIKKPEKIVPQSQPDTALPDSTPQKAEDSAVQLFSVFSHKDTLFSYPSDKLWTSRSELQNTREVGLGIWHEFQRSQLNWTLLVALVCTVLLLTLRLYYNKFISQVFNTLVNFQLADTLMREKNVITRRAFFMLNLIYVLVLSIFILLLTIRFEFSLSGSYLKDFIYILGGFTGVVIARLFLYYIVGYIFEWIPAVTHQIHMNFLVNKNLGLVLLPLVFTAIYTTPSLSGIVLYFSLGLLFLGTLYKIIRGFQIIIRNGVLLFYAIVYLCTLEILPIVVASKVILLLR